MTGPFFYPQPESRGHDEKVLVRFAEQCHSRGGDGRLLEACTLMKSPVVDGSSNHSYDVSNEKDLTERYALVTYSVSRRRAILSADDAAGPG